MLTMIFAADNDWAIGRDGGLLCRLPEDMKSFKERTTGHVVVMGRKTYESFPKRPLPDRENCVISRSVKELEGAKVFGSVVDFLQYADTIKDEVFVIGGGEIYSAMLPYCERAIVTRVYENFGGDTFAPDLDAHPDWQIVESSSIVETGCRKIRFFLYERTKI